VSRSVPSPVKVTGTSFGGARAAAELGQPDLFIRRVGIAPIDHLFDSLQELEPRIFGKNSDATSGNLRGRDKNGR
jgi:hypothetical protein